MFYVSNPIGGSFDVTLYPLRNLALLDTGSTLHVFNQVARFNGLEPAQKGDFLWAGENKVPVEGYGTVDIKLGSKASTTNNILRLQRVAYCPNFAANLVSYRQLEKAGMYWDPLNRYLRDNMGVVLGKVQDIHDQYVLEYLPEPMTQAVFFVRRNKFNSWTERTIQSADAHRWHLRLGHPGPATLEHLPEFSTGVRIKAPTTVECDQCGTAKLTRQIRRNPRRKGLSVGEVLAINFHDYAKDNQGYTSIILITDRATGYHWDYYFQTRPAIQIITILHFHLACD